MSSPPAAPATFRSAERIWFSWPQSKGDPIALFPPASARLVLITSELGKSSGGRSDAAQIEVSRRRAPNNFLSTTNRTHQGLARCRVRRRHQQPSAQRNEYGFPGLSRRATR